MSNVYSLKRHDEINHISHNKYEGSMYVLKLKELKANLTQQKIQKGNVASVTASYELSQMIVINGKSYTEGDFIKQYFAKMAEIVVHKRHACSKIFH